MMYPGVDEALDAIVSTVENDITPHVDDALAASLCRTVAQMLRSVRVRVALENDLLHEDNAALRHLLEAWASELPEAARVQASEAVLAAPQPTLPPLTELQADATRLRAALVTAIEAVPETDHGFRKAARAYLTQQLGHEKLWMQDAFTGPRR
ncbi:hypothetical protein KUG88_25230 [Rhodococcus rhodochrous]|uniref:hypothetical protein n=1 Tax=Rhodococcus rhodochrous TaxID=1829 RepID=UPI001E3F3920|nr:hypothetical protein [Rhodococcus rhodochrous]MCB8913426.1 hypothetical protein [Rhodococcus rhodochrous]